MTDNGGQNIFRTTSFYQKSLWFTKYSRMTEMTVVQGTKPN